MVLAIEKKETVESAATDLIEDSYPLSPLQQGMLFHSLYAPQSGVDIEQVLFKIRAGLKVEALRRAWKRIIERHAILRTSFLWEGLPQPLQQVHAHARLQFMEEDWRGLSEREQHERKMDYLRRDRQQGFQLTEESLMRIALFQVSQSDYYLIWTFHHLLLDGRSFVQVLREVYTLYDSALRGEEPQTEPSHAYRDYIEWLQQLDMSKAEEFWRGMLKGLSTPTSLPAIHNIDNTPENNSGHGELEIKVPAATISGLKALASECGVTLYTLTQAAWALLLSRYAGERDVVFGATRACRRSAPEWAWSMVGLFINTLPVRLIVRPDEQLICLLKRIRSQHIELREYEHTPLQKVQQWSEVPGGRPLFESLLVFENYDLTSVLQDCWSDWEILEFHLLEQTNYPLSLSCWSGEELSLKVEYDRRRFDQDSVRRMLGHLKTLLDGMLRGAHQPVSSLPMLTESECRQILIDWNDTGTGSSNKACVHQLFETRSAQAPDADAVTFGAEQLSYGELNGRANQLAHYLRSLGVGPDRLVGICLERSLEMIVGLLGIMKAGGAYVPLDPASPRERLAAMLEDARAPVLLTQRRLLERLPRTDSRVICLDSDWEAIASSSADNPISGITPENLAYVIYTSGSTGKPKGVLVEHRSLANYIEAASDEFAIKPDDRVLQFASMSFDTSAEEIFSCLANGARLMLRTDSMLSSTSTFLRQCEDWQITILDLPTAYWHELTASMHAEGLSLPPSIRLVIIGGERALPERVAMWRKCVDSRVRLVNTYGPTEATIVAALSDLSTAAIETEDVSNVSVGRPVRNVQTYILDQNLLPVPVGLTGELHIGGAGLARGYLNSPALTSEKFIRNPFSEGPSARLYKTGDLARHQPDGSIQIVGRTDDQVKINGFRIELGEIESALRSHSSVRDAAVLAREDKPGEKRLVAYAVLDKGPESSDQVKVIGELRSFLKTKLPAYMVPAAVVPMEGLPVSTNGKIDRKSLPPPEAAQLQSTGRYARPRDPLERQLVEIWEDILNVHPVGIDDDFFELGGHSLLSVRMMDRIEQTMGIKAPLATLFERATIAHLASALLRQEATRSRSAVIEIQKGNSKPPLFFLHGDFNGGGFYCLNLARGLGVDQPFYAMQPRGLDGEEVPLTVEEMAEYYLEALRAIQPRGPYMLGGYCNGGIIAFEMARRLKLEGEEIDLLALLCASARNVRYKMLQRLTNCVGAVKRLGPEERLNRFLALRDRAVRMEEILRYYRARLRDVSGMEASHQIVFLKEKTAKGLGNIASAIASLLKGRNISSAPSNTNTPSYEPEGRRGYVTASYDKAMLGYVPKRFPGRVTLLWPSELALDNPDEPCAGWSKVADDVDVRLVPGGHITCITKHVHELAGTLKICLENAQARDALL